MINRKFCNWRVLLAFCVFFFVSIFFLHLSVIDKYNDKSQIIQIKTDILSSIDAEKTIITVLGHSSIVQKVTNEVVKKIRAIRSALNVEHPDVEILDSSNEEIRGIEEDELKEPDVIDETVLHPATLDKLKRKLKCFNRSFERKITQRGNYWVFINYIRGQHKPLACHEGLTLTSHSDFTFLDELNPLIARWNSPVSIAIHTPGDDLATALDTMRYMRDCSNNGHLIRKWVSFHIYFHNQHMPNKIPDVEKLMTTVYNCSRSPLQALNMSTTYSERHSLLYPLNVGRNVAREAALTHFVFPLDIELYPSPHLPARFLNMIARDPPTVRSQRPKVYTLVPAEVEKDQTVPSNKTALQKMLKNKKAITFHKFSCPKCHNVPKINEWIDHEDTGQLEIFTAAKRTGVYSHWEPFFITTHSEPIFDERLTWQGKSNKMTQNYIMCVLDYEYLILNNAFLVHHPGIKRGKKDPSREAEIQKTYILLNKILKEFNIMYGTREGCKIKK